MANRYDDGYSALEKEGYQRYEGALGSRLGPRLLQPNDARYQLDRIHMSEILKEQGPPGPRCFGSRIMKEPMVSNFQLSRGFRNYNGTTKPGDWLADYVLAVSTAGGNRR